MITDITPDHLRCVGGACPQVHRCSYGGCASVTSDGKGGLVVIGKIAAGLATQMTRADGRLLSETIGPDETAVLIGEEYFSELPELVRLRDENEKFRAALKEAADDIESWGAYASDYFKDKWDLKGCIAGYRAILSEGKSSSPQTEEKA